jgi:hypothetical protein
VQFVESGAVVVGAVADRGGRALIERGYKRRVDPNAICVRPRPDGQLFRKRYPCRAVGDIVGAGNSCFAPQNLFPFPRFLAWRTAETLRNWPSEGLRSEFWDDSEDAKKLRESAIKLLKLLKRVTLCAPRAKRPRAKS